MDTIDLNLKADNEKDMIAALVAAGFTYETESGAVFHGDAAVDLIGAIYKPTGMVDEIDGQSVPVMAAVPGYHANVRTRSEEMANALDALRVYPETPVRVWA